MARGNDILWRSRLNLLILPFIIIAIILIVVFLMGLVLNGNDKSSYIDSIYLGLVSSTLFFAFVGIFTAIASFASPKDESLDRRLEFLLTSQNISQDAQTYLRAEIKRISAYIEEIDITITIEKIDKDKNHFKVNHNATSRIRNTFDKEIYKDERFELKVFSDSTDDDGVFGQITNAAFFSEIQNLNLLENGVITIKNSGELKFIKELLIPSGGTSNYYLNCWIFNSIDLPYFLSLYRYAESARINIVNQSGGVAKLDISFGKTGEVEIQNGSNYVCNSGKVEPGLTPIFRLLSVS